MSFRIIVGTLIALETALPAAVAKAQDADANPPKTTMGGPPKIYSWPSSRIPSRGLDERRAPEKEREDDRSGVDKPCDKTSSSACKNPDGPR